MRTTESVVDMKTEPRSVLMLYLKGVAMGAADAVPGVSGGTIAFISGIYEELIRSIRSFDVGALERVWHLDFKGAWCHVNGFFLATLFAGIGTSIFLLSRLMLFWLANYPEMIWSFFFGLIVASAIVVAGKIPKWDMAVGICGIAGVWIGYFITIAAPAETPTTPVFVFLTGMVAICAMILPGISGSFILVLLSKYEYIFTAIKDLRLFTLTIFGAGCAVGLISFSHVLNWTIKRFYGPTVSLLTGLMIGSLSKVWPWKMVMKTFTKPDGEIIPLVERNILPSVYLEATGRDAYFLYAVLLAIAGFCLVYFLEKLTDKNVAEH